MVAAAPRIHPVLVAALERLDKRGRPIAETHRRLGELAELIGEFRPSYEQVRVLVHAHRSRQLGPDKRELLLDLVLRQTPKVTILRLLHS